LFCVVKLPLAYEDPIEICQRRERLRTFISGSFAPQSQRFTMRCLGFGQFSLRFKSYAQTAERINKIRAVLPQLLALDGEESARERVRFCHFPSLSHAFSEGR